MNLTPGICSSHFKGACGVLAAPAAAGRSRGVSGFGLRRRLPPGAFLVPPGREMRAPLPYFKDCRPVRDLADFEAGQNPTSTA